MVVGDHLSEHVWARGAIGVIVGIAIAGVAACSPAEVDEQVAAQAAPRGPEEARAIEACTDLVRREVANDGRGQMGQDIGSSALLNPDGDWRALVMNRATWEDGCSTLITAACSVALRQSDSTAEFTVMPTFAQDC